MPSALNVICPTRAEDLRQLNLRIGTTQALVESLGRQRQTQKALLGGLKREREKILRATEARINATPGGAVEFQTLLDQLTAERTGLSVEQVARMRREDAGTRGRGDGKTNPLPASWRPSVPVSSSNPDALSIQGHELESGEPDVLVKD